MTSSTKTLKPKDKNTLRHIAPRNNRSHHPLFDDRLAAALRTVRATLDKGPSSEIEMKAGQEVVNAGMFVCAVGDAGTAIVRRLIATGRMTLPPANLQPSEDMVGTPPTASTRQTQSWRSNVAGEPDLGPYGVPPTT